MTEVVSLALAVDSTSVNSAATAMDRMATSGKAAETAVTRLEAVSKSGGAAAAQALANPQFQVAARNWSEWVGKIRDADGSLKGVAASSTAAAAGLRLTSMQTQILAVQVKDFFESIVSGQNPIRAFAQQAGTSITTVGGFGNAVKLLGGLFTPLRVAIGGGAAAVAAYALAAYDGQKQTDALNRSLQLTGNFSAVTAGSFQTMARAIADSTKSSIGDSREALAAVVATGQFGAQSVRSVAAAVTTFARVSGQSTEDVVKQFAQMRGGVANWAAAASQAYHFLSAEQFRYIRALESQGKTDEAAKVAADALNDALKARAQPLGTIERLLETGKKKWSEWWDAALNVGRPETLEDKLGKVQAALDNAQARGALGARGGKRQSTTNAEIAGLQEDRRELHFDKSLSELSAASTAEAEKRKQQEILQNSSAYQGARAALEVSGARKRSAAAQVALEVDRIALERSYQQNLISLNGYAKAKFFIESQDLAQREQLLNAEIASESRRVIPDDKTPEGLARQARLVDLESRRAEIEKQRIQLRDKFQHNELKPDKVIDFFKGDDFRRFEIGGANAAGAVDAAFNEVIGNHRKSAADAANDLIEQNKALNIALIKEDRDRGLAQIANEEAVLRKRLDLDIQTPEAAKVAEDALAEFRIAREKQLTEQLKPEWQKQLEAYRDTNKLMRDSFDTMANGVIQGTEDMWVQFAQTGKLNVTSLINFMIGEFARLNFRKFIASSGFDEFLSGLRGVIGISSRTPTFDTVGDQGFELAGSRAAGGPIKRGQLYQVNENGPGELLNVGGRQYLMAGADGNVSPNKGGKTATGVRDIHVRIDGSTDPARLAALVNEGVVEGLRAYDADLHARGVT